MGFPFRDTRFGFRFSESDKTEDEDDSDELDEDEVTVFMMSGVRGVTTGVPGFPGVIGEGKKEEEEDDSME